MSHSVLLPLRRFFALAAAIVVASSCNSATSPIDQSQVPVLTMVAPIWEPNPIAFAAQEVMTLPAVMVRDQFGRPMAGVTVSFAVTAGGGTLRSPDATTSASGIARPGGWILGPVAGENIVVATIGQAVTISFKLVSMPLLESCNCWDY